MIYCFDIDGTICSSVPNSQYALAKPRLNVVCEINRLHDAGHVIKILTARGSVSGIDYTDLTRSQLAEWGVPYHELIMNKKPHADLFVDDRAVHIDTWLQSIPTVRGIVAGAFDVIHPGYVNMLLEAKSVCTHLTVGLHCDPSLDRQEKLKPVLSVEERKVILQSLRMVDEVVAYETESQLYDLLKTGSFDVRFLGDDYKGKAITGADLDLNIHWIDRSHSYSTTTMKRAIYESVAEKDRQP
jgi:cytidyltransferase-like protein